MRGIGKISQTLQVGLIAIVVYAKGHSEIKENKIEYTGKFIRRK